VNTQDTHIQATHIWAKCLNIIRAELSEDEFNNWFKPINAKKFGQDTLVLELPSEFYYEWIEENYVAILRKAIQSVIGPKANLSYEIVVDRGNAVRPSAKKAITPPPTNRNGQKRTIAQLPKVPTVDPKDYDFYGQYHPPTGNYHVNQNLIRSDEQLNSNLNKTYAFETFIEGDSNRVAKNAGITIANRPGGTSFNPFVIFGDVGLGKTHLVQAIGNEIINQHPGQFVLYISCEQFGSQFVTALANRSVQSFTDFYLTVDVLIVDDIQFLSGKEKIQEAFFHIFNRLHQARKQVIITSDKPPQALRGLQERLLSRFKWGLTASVDTPSFETRKQIILSKIASEGVTLDESVIDYIAQQVDTNIRELEGVLISLLANASISGMDPTVELAQKTIQNLITETKKTLTIDWIQAECASHYNVTVTELKSRNRKKEIALARQSAMYLAKMHTSISVKAIAEAFGGKDHSTVVHAAKSIDNKLKVDSNLVAHIDSLRRKLDIQLEQE
jgi:chromosomal replication initiator protein